MCMCACVLGDDKGAGGDNDNTHLTKNVQPCCNLCSNAPLLLAMKSNRAQQRIAAARSKHTSIHPHALMVGVLALARMHHAPTMWLPRQQTAMRQ